MPIAVTTTTGGLSMRIEWEIDEVPCIIEVTDYELGDPGRVSGPPERCYPPEPGWVEYRVLTLGGEPAPELADCLDDDDDEAIQSACLEAIESGQRSARITQDDDDGGADDDYHASRAEDSWASGRGY
jgi:hypothetical protein